MGNNEEQLRKACVAHKGFRWTEYGAEEEVMASLLSPHKRVVRVAVCVCERCVHVSLFVSVHVCDLCRAQWQRCGSLQTRFGMSSRARLQQQLPLSRTQSHTRPHTHTHTCSVTPAYAFFLQIHKTHIYKHTPHPGVSGSAYCKAPISFDTSEVFGCGVER